MVELVPYDPIERDIAQRFGYFRLQTPLGPWLWYPCTPDRMSQEPDGSEIRLIFGREQIHIRGAKLGEIPLSIAGGNCLGLVVYIPGYHQPPGEGQTVITSIDYFTAKPPRPGRPRRAEQPAGNGEIGLPREPVK